MNEPTEEVLRLLGSASALLARQRTALIHGEIRRVERGGEAIAEVLAAIREHLDMGGVPVDPETLRRFRHLMRMNRILLENGLSAADHFMASLCATPERTPVMLSERA